MVHPTMFEILCLLRIVKSAMELIKLITFFSNTEKELLLMSDAEMRNV